MPVEDANYLLNDQYRDAANLNARAQLHARFSTNRSSWFRWLFDQLALPAHASVLEIGCGPGWFWQENRDRLPSGWAITLTDFSPGMLAEAQGNLSPLARPLSFRRVDAQDIPLPDASQDAVFAHFMLYHVPDRQRALSEIQRVLKPTGCLYAATNGADNLREIDDLVLSVAPELEPGGVFVHAREFTLENGAHQLLRQFSDVRASWYDDELLITEVEPLIAYILSGPARARLNHERVARLRESAARTIAEQGSLRVRKSTGVFTARDPKR
jgi:ubiquinone/menaquinone biosynthesis C-methylase UbiE